MRRTPFAVLAALCLLTPAISRAQDSTKAPTAEAAVGTGVADKALSGAAESFPAGTASVACFARITGAAGGEVQFVWYKGDAEQARVTQKITYSPHRTWTTKKLPEDAAGAWRCDVVQGEKVLASVKFTVQ